MPTKHSAGKRRPGAAPVFQDWVITRSLANPAIAEGFHYQISTRDTYSGFAVIPGMIPLQGLNVSRGKAHGNADTFTLILANAVTITIVGRIEYRGDWTGIP